MCTTKTKFTVVVPGNADAHVEADYFTINEHNGLVFHVKDGNGYVASFRNWDYVIKEG